MVGCYLASSFPDLFSSLFSSLCAFSLHFTVFSWSAICKRKLKLKGLQAPMSIIQMRFVCKAESDTDFMYSSIKLKILTGYLSRMISRHRYDLQMWDLSLFGFLVFDLGQQDGNMALHSAWRAKNVEASKLLLEHISREAALALNKVAMRNPSPLSLRPSLSSSPSLAPTQ